MKIYVPAVTAQPAKIIPLSASPLDEWIDVVEAARLYTSPKKPNGISPNSMKNKVWKKNGKPQLPRGSYTWGPAGWRFHKPTLMGLRRISISFNNAA